MAKARAKLSCHSCGRLHRSDHGGDLHCSAECRDQAAKDRAAVEQELIAAGFTRHAEIPNLWEKAGVHISMDQVIREGFEETLAQHAAAIRLIR